MMYWSEVRVDETNSETCPVADFGFSSADTSGYDIENRIVS